MEKKVRIVFNDDQIAQVKTHQIISSEEMREVEKSSQTLIFN